MNKRLAAALIAYAILAGIAWFVLQGNLRYAMLILFGYFALRSIIAVKGGLVTHQNETPAPEEDSRTERNER